MRTKVTLVLIFLNVALFFFIFKFERQWRTEAASLEARRRVLGAETADIRSIVVTSSVPGGSYRLERTRDAWSLKAPLDWPANPLAVSALVHELGLLEHEASFAVKGLTKIGQSKADYGLENPKLKLTFTSGDPSGSGTAQTETTLRIGDSSKDGSRFYLLSPDGETIHVISRSLVDRLTQPLDQLRADTLLTVQVFEARSLSVQSTTADKSAGVPRVRIRRENPSRWVFDTPITARASKTAVEVVINQLNGLRPKSFSPAAPATLPSVNPMLRISLEGNNRYETLFLGEPVATPPAANAKPGATSADTEYYAQLENRSALFTVVVPNALIEKLRNAPEQLRETQFVDFDRAAVTSITLAAPGTPAATPVVLQRLEAAGNAPDAAPWQVIRRGDGAQAPQTMPADRTAVKRLLDQLAQLTATKFVSDNPSSAELENWGFNRPEREITLISGNAAASTGPAGNATIVLRIGTDGRGNYFARVGNATDPGTSIYAINIDLANEFSVEPMVWRERVVGLVPANARLTALKLTDLGTRQTLLDTKLDAPDAGMSPATKDAVQKLAKLLPNLRARRFRAEAFNADDRAWRFQLDITFTLPAGAAAEQTETHSLLLTERQGGTEQVAGSRDLNATFDVDQAFLDAVWPLAEGRTDPGPAPEPKK